MSSVDLSPCRFIGAHRPLHRDLFTAQHNVKRTDSGPTRKAGLAVFCRESDSGAREPTFKEGSWIKQDGMNTSRPLLDRRRGRQLCSINVFTPDSSFLIDGMQCFSLHQKQRRSKTADVMARDREEKRLLQISLISTGKEIEHVPKKCKCVT